MARLETILAIMTEDEEWDISPILSENLPDLDDASDPRKVMLAFREAAYEAQNTIEQLLEAEPDLEQRTEETDKAVTMISSELHRGKKTWDQVERGLKTWLIRPLADAIRAAVTKLAELLGQERRAERDQPKQTIVTDSDGQKTAPALKPTYHSKSGNEPS